MQLTSEITQKAGTLTSYAHLVYLPSTSDLLSTSELSITKYFTE